MLGLRTFRHLLQLVPQPALPQVSGQRSHCAGSRRGNRSYCSTSYVHVVFTLPRELAPLALQNKRLIYNLLLHASAQTLLEVARDPRHLGAEIGFFSVLHTWDQDCNIIPMSIA